MSVSEWVSFGREKNCRFDPYVARALSDKPNDASTYEWITLTPRQLGYTEHPLYEEMFESERLYAGSREHLPEGRVLDICSPELLLFLAITHAFLKGDVVTAAMGTIRGVVLQSVELSPCYERWVYGVPDANLKRWSLDHKFLFLVRNASEKERELVKVSRPREQPKPQKQVFSTHHPEAQLDTRPGLFCGHIAVNTVLAAYGKRKYSFAEFSRLGLYGLIVNRMFGRMILPGDPRVFLRSFGQIRSMTDFWSKKKFREKLQASLDQNLLVIVLTYAQRRLHGQHFTVVSGYEIYRDKIYWYVSDAQYRTDEYILPSGHSLYSTEDYLRSFPRYGFGIWSPFVIVTKVL